MARSRAILALMDGFKTRVADIGMVMRLERTGEEFKAILTGVSPIDPMLELGSDWREMATMESRRDRTPQIKYGDVLIQVTQLAPPFEGAPSPKWKAIRRDDNPANFAVKWWLVKITDQDAQS